MTGSGRSSTATTSGTEDDEVVLAFGDRRRDSNIGRATPQLRRDHSEHLDERMRDRKGREPLVRTAVPRTRSQHGAHHSRAALAPPLSLQRASASAWSTRSRRTESTACVSHSRRSSLESPPRPPDRADGSCSDHTRASVAGRHPKNRMTGAPAGTATAADDRPRPSSSSLDQTGAEPHLTRIGGCAAPARTRDCVQTIERSENGDRTGPADRAGL